MHPFRHRSSALRGALLAVLAALLALPAAADVLDLLTPLGRGPSASAPPALAGFTAEPAAFASRAPSPLRASQGPAPDALGATPAWSWESNTTNASAGQTAITAGDVNGDGYSDLVALGASGSNSSIYLFFGSSSGFALAPGYPVTMTNRGASQINAAGDLNGDGYADVVVGMPQGAAGQIRVYYGGPSGFDTVNFFEFLQNYSPFWASSVGPAGDVNGDGYDDLIVGSPSELTWSGCSGSGFNQGRVDVFYGSATGVHTEDWILWGCRYESNASVGAAAAAAGDVNGDGYADIVIGAPNAAVPPDNLAGGCIWIVYGSASGLPLTPGYANVGSLAGASRINSPTTGANFGASASSAGDVNGDGYADVAVGAPYDDTGSTDGGYARVYAGSASGLTTTLLWYDYSTIASARFGTTLAPAGDVNGDGKGDLLVGEASRIDVAQSYAGSLFMNRFYGTSYPANTGPAGDLNGDGLCDFVVGDRYYSNGQTGEGRLMVYAGSGDGPVTLPTWSFSTIYDNPNLGWSVASAGDVNGDGLDDVLIGAPTWDNLATPSDLDDGIVFLYMGTLTGLAANPSWYYVGATADQLGISVCGIGDVNGDGYADFAAGAHQPGVGYGKVLVFLGHAGGPSSTPDRVLGGPSFDSQFGTAVTGGDFNGDGYADLAVGSPNNDGGSYTNCGGAFMYLGGPSGTAAANLWAAQGTQNDEHFGASLNGFADTNGDGYCDLVVGSPGRDVGSPFALLDCGRISEFDGGHTANVLEFRQTIDGSGNEQFGSCIGNAGDVNGDGYSDVAVGAPYASQSIVGQGRAVVFAGSVSGLVASAFWSQLGGEAYGAFGSSVAGAGDVNGDGLSDVLVGAVFQDDGGAADRGTGRVYLGPLPAGAAAFWTAHGPSAYANMGHALANAGDIDGDGWSDLVFGEPGYTSDTYRQGRVELYPGGLDDSRLNLTLARRTTAGPNIVPTGFANAGGAPVILHYAPSASGRTKFRMQWDVQSVVALPSAPLSGSSAAWTGTASSAYGQLGAAFIPVNGMQTGVPYSWRVRARFRNPYFPTSRWISPVRSGAREYDMRSPGTWVGVEGEAPVPASATLALAEPSPNPARGATSLAFTLPHAGRVTLDVVDVQGRRVRTLLDATRPAGTHRVTWDGLDDGGRAAASGLYFVRVDAAGERASRKLARIR